VPLPKPPVNNSVKNNTNSVDNNISSNDFLNAKSTFDDHLTEANPAHSTVGILWDSEPTNVFMNDETNDDMSEFEALLDEDNLDESNQKQSVAKESFKLFTKMLYGLGVFIIGATVFLLQNRSAIPVDILPEDNQIVDNIRNVISNEEVPLTLEERLTELTDSDSVGTISWRTLYEINQNTSLDDLVELFGFAPNSFEIPNESTVTISWASLTPEQMETREELSIEDRLNLYPYNEFVQVEVRFTQASNDLRLNTVDWTNWSWAAHANPDDFNVIEGRANQLQLDMNADEALNIMEMEPARVLRNWLTPTGHAYLWITSNSAHSNNGESEFKSMEICVNTTDNKINDLRPDFGNN